MIMSNFQVERLKVLPQRTDEVWEGGLVRLPIWDWDEAGRPYRPWAAVWINPVKGTIHMGSPQLPARKSYALALEALIEMATRPKLAGYRPGALVVNDAALAEHLGGLLAEASIEVRYEERLENLQKGLAGVPEFRGFATAPGAFAGKGVTLEGMRAYAEASAEFYRAAPWRNLNDGDLIAIAAPKAPKGMECAVVMGEGGRTYGLSFFASARQFQTMMDRGVDYFRSHGAWSVTFDSITHLPFEDADLWEDHGLPVAEAMAHPLAYYQSPSGANKRPTGKQLAFLEGLLRALARTGVEEMDAGRWAKTVETSLGETEYRLAIPSLLTAVVLPQTDYQQEMLEWPGGYEGTRELMERILKRDPSISEEAALRQAMAEMVEAWEDGEPEQPLTNEEKAAHLTTQAEMEMGHRMRVRLSRLALELDPDSIEAYVQLADASNDLEERQRLFQQGMEIGRRVLSAKEIRRPGRDERVRRQRESYLDAWAGLGTVLAQQGRYEQAANQGIALLEADPKDEMGFTYILVPCLLILGRDEQAEEMWKGFANDDTPSWLYVGALVAFRRNGRTQGVTDKLWDALESDEMLGEYLAGGPIESAEEEEEEELEQGVDFTGEDAEQIEKMGESLKEMLAAPEPDFEDGPPENEPGQETDEQLLREAWAATPGAEEWLRGELEKYREQ